MQFSTTIKLLIQVTFSGEIYTNDSWVIWPTRPGNTRCGCSNYTNWARGVKRYFVLKQLYNA